ncbi:IQ domain-containing protein C [Paralichthys olivaceus]|uniref:IQ domain-containing protein C n=1 Tax=Paralichthys olivaceus TaxID=8255 RepID=UPI00097D3BED|nr:PREDICTED: IQ domain-containing protein C [Paralichthys olivaceus]
MERRKWEKTLTHFQARARGYLVRQEVGRAREDFEDIVKEIDGGLKHLQWRSSVIPIPHFTDADDPFLRPRSDASEGSDPGLDVCTCPLRSTAAPSQDREEDLLSQKIEAEKDESGTKGQAHLPSDCDGDVEGPGQREQEGDKHGEAGESIGDSTTLWSSLELDVNHSHCQQGPRQYCLAQDVPQTPQALRLHRNTLTMELVWLQQAIESRKKYLSLKDRLTIS